MEEVTGATAGDDPSDALVEEGDARRWRACHARVTTPPRLRDGNHPTCVLGAEGSAGDVVTGARLIPTTDQGECRANRGGVPQVP
jgi:hypothetical protein